VIGCRHPAHSSAFTAVPSPAAVVAAADADAEAADAGDDVSDDVTTSGAVAAGDDVVFSVISADDARAVNDSYDNYVNDCNK